MGWEEDVGFPSVLPQQGWLNWNVARAGAASGTWKAARLRRVSLQVDMPSHGVALL